MRTLECVRVLEGHVEAVLALTVMRGHLISGSYDTTVRFWRNNGTFDCVGKFEGHDDAVRVLTSSGEDAEKVYSGSYDGSIGFWSAPMAAGASTSGAAIADAICVPHCRRNRKLIHPSVEMRGARTLAYRNVTTPKITNDATIVIASDC